jgi:hypothetical protein
LALTSATSGGHSVGIVRKRTQATEIFIRAVRPVSPIRQETNKGTVVTCTVHPVSPICQESIKGTVIIRIIYSVNAETEQAPERYERHSVQHQGRRISPRFFTRSGHKIRYSVTLFRRQTIPE